jgi:ribose transport system substrate-binding protein
MRKLFKVITTIAVLIGFSSQSFADGHKPTIALVPGLTTDAFYITMHKGAMAAAEALGVELLFQGSPEWNASLQVPILNAIIAKKPDAILIAPNDKQQLIAPLKAAADAGIAVICVDTFIDDGVFQDGMGDGDFPISYVASDNVLGGVMAGNALANAIGKEGTVYVSNVKPGISTTDQREEGFKAAMLNYPNITVLETQFNDNDANKASAQVNAVVVRAPDLAGIFGANLFSAIGSADGVKAMGKTGEIKVVAFDAPTRIVDDLKSGYVDLAIAQHPAEIGYMGVMVAYGHVTGNPVPVAIGTGFTVMTADNIDDPNISKYVYSD